jgi:hypothetical protein
MTLHAKFGTGPGCIADQYSQVGVPPNFDHSNQEQQKHGY